MASNINDGHVVFERFFFVKIITEPAVIKTLLKSWFKINIETPTEEPSDKKK